MGKRWLSLLPSYWICSAIEMPFSWRSCLHRKISKRGWDGYTALQGTQFYWCRRNQIDMFLEHLAKALVKIGKYNLAWNNGLEPRVKHIKCHQQLQPLAEIWIDQGDGQSRPRCQLLFTSPSKNINKIYSRPQSGKSFTNKLRMQLDMNKWKGVIRQSNPPKLMQYARRRRKTVQEKGLRDKTRVPARVTKTRNIRIW
jgi:hypothetical protein